MEDIGNLLFSFTIAKDTEWQDFRRMGRAVRFMNMSRITAMVLISMMIVVLLTMFVSQLFLLLSIAVIFQILVYVEYSSRSIGSAIRDRAPLSYDFYEKAVIETGLNGSNTIEYSQFKGINRNNFAFTMVGKGSDVIVIPRSLIDKDAEDFLIDLSKVLGGRKSGSS